MSKHTGVVKLWSYIGNYGFIIDDAGGPDVFVSQKAVAWAGLDRLEKGAAVEFAMHRGARGPTAVQLKVLADVS